MEYRVFLRPLSITRAPMKLECPDWSMMGRCGVSRSDLRRPLNCNRSPPRASHVSCAQEKPNAAKHVPPELQGRRPPAAFGRRAARQLKGLTLEGFPDVWRALSWALEVVFLCIFLTWRGRLFLSTSPFFGFSSCGLKEAGGRAPRSEQVFLLPACTALPPEACCKVRFREFKA